MKIRFTPQQDREISLFSNWGEAVVFWICIAGLLLLAYIVTVKAVNRERMRSAFQELRTEQQQILKKLERLESEKQFFKKENDRLRAKVENLQSNVSTIQSRGSGSTGLPGGRATPEEKSRSSFLKASQNKQQ